MAGLFDDIPVAGQAAPQQAQQPAGAPVYGPGSAYSNTPATAEQAAYAAAAQQARDPDPHAPAGTATNPSYDTPDLTGAPDSYHVNRQGQLSDPNPQVNLFGDIPTHGGGVQTVGPDGKPTSQGLGFAEGLNTVAKNLTDAFSGNLPGVPNGPLAHLGIPSAVSPLTIPLKFVEALAQGQTDNAEKTYRPGTAGKIGGELAASAPFAMDAEAPAIMGALQGYLTSESHNPLGKFADIGMGSLGGKIGDAAMNGVRAVIAPVVRPAAQWAADHGIGITTGQTLGGIPQWAEGLLGKGPIVGTMVRGSQNRTIDDFGRATYNGLLKPAGLAEIPSSVAPGNAANAAAHKAFSDAYSAVLPPLTVGRDAAFNDGVPALANAGTALGASHGPAYTSLLNEGLGGFDANGQMTGPAFKDFDTKLGQEIRAASRDPALMSQKYGSAIQDLQSHFRDALERSNPAQAPQLSALNRGYAGLVTADKATVAQATNEGRFTPDDLIRAARATDFSNRKSSTAAGEAMLQQWANAAKKNGVPNKYGAGGSLPGAISEALVTMGVGKESGLLHGVGGLAAIDALLAGAYTKPAQKVINAGLTQRPAAAKAISNMLGEVQPVASWLGATAAPKALPRYVAPMLPYLGAGTP